MKNRVLAAILLSTVLCRFPVAAPACPLGGQPLFLSGTGKTSPGEMRVLPRRDKERFLRQENNGERARKKNMGQEALQRWHEMYGGTRSGGLLKAVPCILGAS